MQLVEVEYTKLLS